MLYSIFKNCFAVIFKLLFRFEAVNAHYVPAEGPVVLCSNHRSNFDPPMVGCLLKRQIRFMAKEELFRVPVVGWLITKWGAYPVKRGGVSKESIRLSMQLLKEGNILGIFPEGSRSNSGGMGKKGASSLAIKTGATVIPAAIVGDYKFFRKMKVIYGPPVDLSEFAEISGPEALEQATEKIMKQIRALAKQHQI
ncbi:lysophospholipid acyltransferase family protein [Paenibacillus sp. y28]|uniref:lysophospholipid acyltransferase family protein n=1 Tax=Paenibacillus sp. y28 TaxID=3129110 RepID=UPI003016CB0E